MPVVFKERLIRQTYRLLCLGSGGIAEKRNPKLLCLAFRIHCWSPVWSIALPLLKGGE